MAELKGKLRMERLDWFENWINTKQERLSLILNEVEGLDFSINSLNTIEAYLIETFNDSMQVFLLENSVLMDSVATYIGEVFRKNAPVEMSWTISTDSDIIKSEYKDYFNFKCLLKGTQTFGGFDPFLNLVPNVVYAKTGVQIITMYNKSLASHYERIQDPRYSNLNKENQPPEPNGFLYHHYIFFNKQSTDLLRDKIKSYVDNKSNCTLKEYSSRLVVTYQSRYNFHFDFDLRPEVREEYLEFSQSNLEDISSEIYNARIEFWGDEDDNGDYLNEYMFILEYLAKEQVRIYNISQGMGFDW